MAGLTPEKQKELGYYTSVLDLRRDAFLNQATHHADNFGADQGIGLLNSATQYASSFQNTLTFLTSSRYNKSNSEKMSVIGMLLEREELKRAHRLNEIMRGVYIVPQEFNDLACSVDDPEGNEELDNIELDSTSWIKTEMDTFGIKLAEDMNLLFDYTNKAEEYRRKSDQLKKELAQEDNNVSLLRRRTAIMAVAGMYALATLITVRSKFTDR